MITTLYITLADAAAPAPSGGLGGTFAIPMICMGVIFYFLIIRPQSKQRKELADLVSTLKTGDKVVTASGIHGIISNVKDGATLMLKIADNVKIEINKSAIATVVTEKADKTSSAVVAAS